MVKWSINWVTGNLIWLMVKTQLYQMWNPNEAWAYTNGNNINNHYPDISENDELLPPIQTSDGIELEGPGDSVVAPGGSNFVLSTDLQ